MSRGLGDVYKRQDIKRAVVEIEFNRKEEAQKLNNEALSDEAGDE